MWELRPLGIIYTCNPSHCFMGMVEELAEQMERLIKNPKLAEKLGENAMNSVREKWNEKRMAQDIWEFCREIVG